MTERLERTADTALVRLKGLTGALSVLAEAFQGFQPAKQTSESRMAPSGGRSQQYPRRAGVAGRGTVAGSMLGRTTLLIVGTAMAMLFASGAEAEPRAVETCAVMPEPNRNVAQHPKEEWSLALWRDLVGLNKTEHPLGFYDETVDILRRAGKLSTYSGPLPRSLREATKQDPCAFRFSKEMVGEHAVYYAVRLTPRSDLPYPAMEVEIEVHGDKGRIYGQLGPTIPTELVPPEAKGGP
jgi:hypothetical protein